MSSMEEDKVPVESAPKTAAEAGTSETGKKNLAIDYTKLEKDIEDQRDLALKGGKLNEALEALLNIEKQMRLAADVQGTKQAVLAIVKICKEAGDWKALNDNVQLLAKRRAQLKQAVQGMVQEAMSYLDQTPDVETKIELIKTLSNVAAGKIYVEIERARLTKMLARIKEEQGDINEAAEIMQAVAVETFGAMAKTEKIAFILDQVRLCLDKKDYMRAQILSKKINPRAFVEKVEDPTKKKKVEEAAALPEAAAADIPPLMDLKIIYYQHMIRYYLHSENYLEIARSYLSMYETPSVAADPAKWRPVLKKICWYLVLSPYDSMQSSLLQQTAADKKLSELPAYKALLKLFITMEVVRWPQLQTDFKAEFEGEKEVFGGDGAAKVMENLRLRVIEHNILVVSKYYSRITIKRLAALLDLPVTDAERHLADMVVAKAMYAKVDRPAGIVSFEAPKDSSEVLNGWSRNIEKLLDLVEKSCHQIHKETMVHKFTLQV